MVSGCLFAVCPFSYDAVNLPFSCSSKGDDKIHGNHGNDQLWGQRGDDRKLSASLFLYAWGSSWMYWLTKDSFAPLFLVCLLSDLYGGEGEDELIGGLGSDTLEGGPGNDILLGDVGHCVRRFDEHGNPLLNSDIEGTDSAHVWHKDIVLEEVGKIVSAHLISKTLDTNTLRAETVSKTSILFVANEYLDGAKVAGDEGRGGWPTELILFDLVTAFGDRLDG